MSAAGIATLQPPAPKPTCPEIVDFLGVGCMDDLAGPMNDDSYMGYTLCSLCCDSCKAKGEICVEPDWDDYYDYSMDMPDYFDPFAEDAASYVDQMLAETLYDTGLLDSMEEEFLVVAGNLLIDCSPES